jgi:hypothetical protein
VSAADLVLDLLLKCFFLLHFSGQSKTFAQEIRAIVPLAKGTEVLFAYQLRLRKRAERREFLWKAYKFHCNCELCALPDDLSNALDTKIELASNAAEYLDRFYARKEHDAIHAVLSLDIFMSIMIRERLSAYYPDFYRPLQLLGLFGNKNLLQQVGQAIIRVFHRYLGTGYSVSSGATAGVESVSLFVDEALRHISDPNIHGYFVSIEAYGEDAQLEFEKVISSIISDLQSLP